MKPKIAVVVRGVVLAAALTFGLAGIVQAQVSTNSAKAKAPRTVTVDSVVAHPERFKGVIDVAGRVSSVNTTNSVFALGCEDACVVMPVKFAGTLPTVSSNVVVRGQIKRTEGGRYLFDAEKVSNK